MKKILILIAFLTLSIVTMGQKKTGDDTAKLSNYEKYLLAKENAVSQDTVYKIDTAYVDAETVKEWDDLYYTSRKNDLKMKTKELRLEKKKIRMEQQAEYYDARQEVYNDLYFYSDMRTRMYFGYRPYYYWNMYDPFYYDPFYYDGWNNWNWGFSWSWGSPYYYNSYWNGYGHNRGYSGYNPIIINNNYGYNQSRHNPDNKYGYNNNMRGNDVQYGRRERPSTLSSKVTANKTVEIDRKSGQVVNITTGSRRNSQMNNTSVQRNTNVSPNQREQASTRPVIGQSRREYTPTYEQPKTTVKPQFNNSTPSDTRRYNTSPNSNPSQNTNASSNYNRGREVNSNTSTQQRNVVAPSTRRSESYSAPSRSSNYSTPSRSSNYSAPSNNSNSSSRSSSSYSGGGSVSSGSYSGGSSSSGSSSGSSGGGGGRRR